MKKILIDTDVILDLFFDREPFTSHASRLFSKIESGQLRAYITPVICSNVYYILRRSAGHGKVTEKLMQLLRIINILPMDEKIVLHALHSDFRDFEDALQYQAALKADLIDVILTRNVRDYRNSEIAVMSPQNFLLQE